MEGDSHNQLSRKEQKQHMIKKKKKTLCGCEVAVDLDPSIHMPPTHARDSGWRAPHQNPFHHLHSLLQPRSRRSIHGAGYLNPPLSSTALAPPSSTDRHEAADAEMSKGLAVLLLVMSLALSSGVGFCGARSGKHWRQNRGPSTTMFRWKGKGKGKNGGGSPSHGHRQYGKGHQSPAMPAPPSPGGGNGHASPSPPQPPPSLPPQAPSVPPSPPPPLPPSLPPPEEPSQGAVFSVVAFGARGDGVTDDTQAFEAAWAAACKVEASMVLVPPELEFVVGPISFSGPNCRPNIIFQLDGTISAQTGASAWGSGLLQWLEFTKLNGISIQGSGVINGQGKEWWTYSDSNDDHDDMDSYTDQELEKMPQIKPTALRFYGSTNVRVTGISIVNSPQCHLKFDSCQGVMVHNLTISSPETSPNTDGIHLQNSKDVNIHHTDLACGDDCISIQTGCSDVNIHNVNCGPGHGISIGGLGRYNTKACVPNITVRDVNMFKTMTGVRIKTWQGGSGLVQGIRFSNIHMSEVQTPIMIDQFYCDKTSCTNQTSAVAVSDVQYENIRGTFTIKPAHFACSDSSPCSEITLTGIQLRPLIVPQYHMCSSPFCWQAFGELYTPTIPPIPCLQLGKPAGNRVLSEHDQC